MDRDTERFRDRQINQLFGTTVSRIRKDGDDYVVNTNRGPMLARSVVVCAGGHSLLMAQEMGFGLEYSCLPIAGSFYFAPEALNGKVYRVQNPKLPFAAVHGDHDIKERGKTRFGPTALMLPMLERYNPSTVREIRKIVPDIQARDIEYAEGFGGIRPQLIDRRTRELKLGEVKIIDGHGIVFNMTSSPGGTSCLANAEQDMRLVARHLGAQVDWDGFQRELLTGHEDSRDLPPPLLAAAS
jgi:malate dehydrogenase (quinone)